MRGILAFCAALSALAASAAARAPFLAEGERAADICGGACAARLDGNPAEHGGGVTGGDGRWTVRETSGGSIPNRAMSVTFRFGPETEAVKALNAAYGAEKGGEPVDFQLRMTLRRTEKSNNLLFSQIRAEGHGDRRRDIYFPRAIDLKASPDYIRGERVAVGDAVPGGRIRVFPEGAPNAVREFFAILEIRVEDGARPEAVETADIALVRIDKGEARDLGGKGAALCPRGLPPPGFLAVWRAQGLTARLGMQPGPGEKTAAVFVDGFDLRPDEAQTIARMLDAGGVLYLSPGLAGAKLPDALQPYMPVNDWPIRREYRRGPTEIGPTADAGLDVQKIPFESRFDLHVPGAGIESPLFRYRPERYLRDRAKFARISVAMECKTDGCLPALIDADVGPSRVQVFAGSYLDARAWRAPGYAAWCEAAAKLPFGAKGADKRPEGNDAKEPAVRAAWKKWAIALEEDESTMGELSGQPAPREGVDGISSYRYVYRPGTAPKLKVRIRNHYNNVAPLAKARDLEWPQNHTAAGLNDFSYSMAGVRGRLPINAWWCGRPNAVQRLELAWDLPTVIAGTRLVGGGPLRRWEQNNPADFKITAGGKTLADVSNVKFAHSASDWRAFWDPPPFEQRVCSDKVTLEIRNLDPKANREPRCESPANCALAEWEVMGWCGPAEKGAGDAEVTLSVTTTYPDTGWSESADKGAFKVRLHSEQCTDVTLRARDGFGPATYVFAVKDAQGRVLARRAFNVLFVPAAGTKIVRRETPETASAGLLCTPGWRGLDSFGLGMNKWSAGWGGPHDQRWAFSVDCMEAGARNRDDPAKMFTSASGASHYSNPWRRYPSGEYAWDWAADRLFANMESGRWRREGKTALHVTGSDRWNGIPVGSCFGWDVFVDFDRYLRKKGKPGLKGESRGQVVQEISSLYGDEWQRFNLGRYAERMAATRRRFAEKGWDFTFETHGSFPVCGGALGARLAEVDRGVGTDLFWELRGQDLWHSLGGRFAVVAANPDLMSGAYDEWGWVNSEANEFWFANNGDTHTARRQWYATYFAGRVNLSGAFAPYHVSGYSSQGNHGVRYTLADHRWRCRVENFTTQVRPEAPAGYGLVVSWHGQERRMGPRLGRQGFGLYPQNGEDDVEKLGESVYAAFAKQGLPISFVTSTDALKKWKGRNPLLLVDAPNWDDWEVKEVARLVAGGATVISVGEPDARYATAAGKSFFGADRKAADGAGAVVACKVPARAADALSARAATRKALLADGSNFGLSRGLACTPFVSNKHLFLAVCRQGDDSSPAAVRLRPGAVWPGARNARRAVSLDDGVELKTQLAEDGTLTFSFPLEDGSGRIVMLAD